MPLFALHHDAINTEKVHKPETMADEDVDKAWLKKQKRFWQTICDWNDIANWWLQTMM